MMDILKAAFGPAAMGDADLLREWVGLESDYGAGNADRGKVEVVAAGIMREMHARGMEPDHRSELARRAMAALGMPVKKSGELSVGKDGLRRWTYEGGGASLSVVEKGAGQALDVDCVGERSDRAGITKALTEAAVDAGGWIDASGAMLFGPIAEAMKEMVKSGELEGEGSRRNYRVRKSEPTASEVHVPTVEQGPERRRRRPPGEVERATSSIVEAAFKAGDWDELKHPRGDAGRFGESAGGSTAEGSKVSAAAAYAEVQRLKDENVKVRRKAAELNRSGELAELKAAVEDLMANTEDLAAAYDRAAAEYGKLAEKTKDPDYAYQARWSADGADIARNELMDYGRGLGKITADEGATKKTGTESILDAAFKAGDWDELKHPRGNPTNAGQFARGGGGKPEHSRAKREALAAVERRPVSEGLRGDLARSEKTAVEIAEIAYKFYKETRGASVSVFGNVPGDGYAVAPYSEDAVVVGAHEPMGKPEFDEFVRSYLEAKKEKLADSPPNYLGVWVEDDGTMFLDVSVVKGMKAEAERMATDAKQLAIYDVARGRSLYTAGDGKYDLEKKPEKNPFVSKSASGRVASFIVDPRDAVAVEKAVQTAMLLSLKIKLDK